MFVFAIFLTASVPARASGPSSNRVLNYQVRLTDASGVPVADGTKSLKLTFYTAASGGTQLYTACSADGSATGTPTAATVTFASGTASVLIGDTGITCASGSAVAIPATLFDNVAMYLGVTVNADSEMTPRKRIVATGYSLNADKLDDLDSSAVGGSNAFVPVTDSSGNFTLTRNVTVDTDTFFVDATNNAIGVGTITPASGVQLELEDVTDDNTAQEVLALHRSRSSASAPSAADFGADLTFRLEGATNNSDVIATKIRGAWDKSQTNDTTERDSYLAMYTMDSNALAERMRIDASGRVGIGTGATINSGAGLHINNGFSEIRLTGTGNAFADISVTLENTTGGTGRTWLMYSSGNDSKFYIDKPGSEGAFTINDSRQVGIGTASPSNQLTVSGNADITGNLGVGTASPAARLHVQKGAGVTDVTDSNAIVQFESDGNATNFWFNVPTSGGGGTNATIGFATAGTVQHGLTYNVTSDFLALTNDGGNASPTSGLFVDSSGNVGVGDNSPDATFDVTKVSTSTSAATEIASVIDFSDTGVVTTGTDFTNGLDINLTRTGATGGTITTTGLDIDIIGDAGGTSKAIGIDVTLGGTIDTAYAALFNGGYVGIGTTTPMDTLNVNGVMRWGGVSTDYAYSGQDVSGLYFEQVGSTSAKSPMRIQSSKSGDLTNYASLKIDPYSGFVFSGTGTAVGNVGIGDSSPASLLTVGDGDRFNVNAFGDVTSNFTTLNGSSTASGAGSNSTTLVLAASGGTNFDVGNYVKVDSTSCVTGVNTCYAKITAKSTDTLTISPAISWADTSVVTEVHVPEIGGLDLTQALVNRYGRGYFIDGIVTGNGTTRFSDNLIDTTANTLNFNTLNNRPVQFGTGSVNIGGDLVVTGSISSGGSTAFVNGGNSFAGAAVLGTNNANSLSFETNNVSYFTIASGGGFTLPVDTDWTLTGGVNGLSFDGTTFSVDATNNRIGIGTAAPFLGQLHVNAANAGGLGGDLWITNSGTNTVGSSARLAFGADSTTDATANAGIENIVTNTSSFLSDLAFKFYDGSAYNEKFRMKGDTGRFGIGTNAPSAKLEVSAGSGAKAISFDTAAERYVDILNGGLNELRFWSTKNAADAGTFTFTMNSAGKYSIWNESTELFDLLGNGRAALGVPQGFPLAGINAKLHVKNAAADSGVPTLILQGAASQTGNILEAKNDGGTLLTSISPVGAIATTIAAGANAVGLTVTQNDTTNNPRGVSIVNTGTAASLFIDPNGNTSASTSIGGALLLENTGNLGSGIVVYSNAGAATAGARLLSLRADNTAYDQNVMAISNDGSGTSLDINNSGGTGGAISATAAGAGHTIGASYTGTTASVAAGTFTSTNNNFTAFQVTGHELGHGTIKATNVYDGIDNTNAAVLSLDRQGVGTKAQGIFIDSTAAGGSTGKILNLRNDGTEHLTLTYDGLLGLSKINPNEVLQVNGGTRTGLAPTTLTTLNGAITNSDTTVTVVDTTNYPQAGTLIIDNEAMTYAAKTATTFTGVTRGALATTAVAHVSGSTVSNLLMTVVASTGATPKFVVTGGSNVGIRTATPSTNFEVVGDALISPEGANSNHSLSVGQGSLTTAAGGFGRLSNYLTYSEQFDNAVWVKTGVTVTANSTVGPDNISSNADTIGAGGVATDGVAQTDPSATSVASTTTWIGSVWLRTSSGTAIVSLKIDPTTSGNSTTNTFTVTNAWKRYSVTHVFSASAGSARFSIINGTSAVFAWGAQLQADASSIGVTSYVRTEGKNLLPGTNIVGLYANSGWLGGDLTFTAGQVTRNISVRSEGAGFGGSGLSLTAGAAGGATGVGLAGGNVTLTAGAAAAASSGDGGNGGRIILSATNGSAAATSGAGGPGGSFTFTAGNGANAAGASVAAGSGGGFTFTPGTGATNGGGGAGSSAGNAGGFTFSGQVGGGGSSSATTVGSGSAFSVTLGGGGANSGGAPAIGGAGGTFSITGGTGGASSASTANGGAGSLINLVTGTGGANTGTAAGAGTGGAGGEFRVTTGGGGNAGSSSQTGAGGASGAITLQLGTGGIGSPTGAGGAGGTFSITGGTGGASGATSGTGGAGSAILLTAGAGGAGTTTGGAGGSISLTAGNSGTGGNANGGTITLNAGNKTGTGTAGSLVFQVASSTKLIVDPDGNVGVGTGTPREKLTLGDGSHMLLDSGYFTSPFVSFGQHTNFLKFSEDFSNAAWVKSTGVSVTSNNVTSPDTVNNTADTLGAGDDSADNVQQTNAFGGASANNTYTAQVWLKVASGSTTVNLRIDSSNTTGTASAKTVTTAWQRFSVSQTFGGGSTGTPIFVINHGTTAVQAWGAQMEGSSSRSAYLPTLDLISNTYDDVGFVASGVRHEFYSGDVSIGPNPTPDDLLHVYGGSAGSVTADGAARVVIEDDASAYLSFNVASTFESGLVFGQGTTAVDGAIIYTSSDELRFRTNGNTNRAVLNSAGNFGVQTLGAASATSLCYDTTTISGFNTLTTCSSSLRYKEDVRDLAVDVQKVLSLRPVDFKWKNRDERSVGFIAEEVAQIIPEVITYRDGQIEGIEYKLLTAYLIGVLKDQDARIQALSGATNLGEDGTMHTVELVADRIAVRQTDSLKTISKGTILSGSSAVVVSNLAIKENSEIFVTFKKNPGSAWWIDETHNGSFILKTALPVAEDVAFTYWIVDVVDETTPPPPPPPQEPPAVPEAAPTTETPSESEVESAPPAAPQEDQVPPPTEPAPTPTETPAEDPVPTP